MQVFIGHDNFGDKYRILMAALLGKIDQFDPELEGWPQYVERLEQFLEANNLSGEDKVTKRVWYLWSL